MTASLKLYEAVEAIDIVREWVYSHDEELSANEGALPPELAELLEQAEGNFEEKAERVGLFIRELNATADSIEKAAEPIRAEAVRLADRAKAVRSRANRLRDLYLFHNMKAAGIPRIDGELVTLRIQKNPAKLVMDTPLSQEDLRDIVDDNPSMLGLIPFTPGSYSLDAKAIITAAKKETGTGKAKVVTYESPIPGIRIVQEERLAIV